PRLKSGGDDRRALDFGIRMMRRSALVCSWTRQGRGTSAWPGAAREGSWPQAKRLSGCRAGNRGMLVRQHWWNLSFNLLPGQRDVGGARHIGFSGEKVAGCWAFAAAFGPAWPGPGGFRDTGGGSQAGADVAKPPADPAWCQRTGRIGVLLPGPAEVGGQGTGEQELGAGGHEEPGPAVGLL